MQVAEPVEEMAMASVDVSFPELKSLALHRTLIQESR